MGGKAKRARERVRMGIRDEVMTRVASWIDSDTWPEAPYNMCNLNIRDEHADECDGSCGPLTQWEAKVAYENELWKDEKAQPKISMAELKMNVLLNILIERGMFTQEEIDDLFHKQLYETLNHMRIHELPNVKKEALRQQLVPNTQPPRPHLPFNGRQ